MDAYITSNISIEGAYNTTVEWSASVNGSEFTPISGDSYQIPMDATASDVYVFKGKAYVLGKDDIKVYSDELTLTVNILVNPTSYTFDFTKNTFGISERGADIAVLDKTIKDVVTGVTIKVTGRARVWTTGLRLHNGTISESGSEPAGEITFIAPEGYEFSNFDFKGDPVTPVLSENKKEIKIEGPTVTTTANKEIKTAELTWVESKGTVGVAGVEAGEGEARWYDVQGRQVSADAKGLLIMVKGGKAIKVLK